MEPLSNLKKMTKAELEDHEYERIIVDDFSESFDSITKHNSAWKNDDVETNGPSRRRKEEIELQSKDDKWSITVKLSNLIIKLKKKIII